MDQYIDKDQKIEELEAKLTLCYAALRKSRRVLDRIHGIMARQHEGDSYFHKTWASENIYSAIDEINKALGKTQ